MLKVSRGVNGRGDAELSWVGYGNRDKAIQCVNAVQGGAYVATMACEPAITNGTFHVDFPIVRDVDSDKPSIRKANLDHDDAFVRAKRDRSERNRLLLFARVSGRKSYDEECDYRANARA